MFHFQGRRLQTPPLGLIIRIRFERPAPPLLATPHVNRARPCNVLRPLRFNSHRKFIQFSFHIPTKDENTHAFVYDCTKVLRLKSPAAYLKSRTQTNFESLQQQTGDAPFCGQECSALSRVIRPRFALWLSTALRSDGNLKSNADKAPPSLRPLMYRTNVSTTRGPF